MRARPRLPLLVLGLLLACGADGDETPPPPGNGSPPGLGDGGPPLGDTGVGGDTGLDGDDTGIGPTSATGEPPGGCAPAAEAIAQCGIGPDCEFVFEQCLPAGGIENEDSPCSVTNPGEWLPPADLQNACPPTEICLFPETSLMQCSNACDPFAPICPQGTICVGIPPGDVLPEEALTPGFCLRPCDPFANECPGAPLEVCYPLISATGEVVTGCLPVGLADVGESCDSSWDCQDGLVCTQAAFHSTGCGAEACCSRLCDLGVASCFGGNSECVPLDLEIAPSVGFCARP